MYTRVENDLVVESSSSTASGTPAKAGVNFDALDLVGPHAGSILRKLKEETVKQEQRPLMAYFTAGQDLSIVPAYEDRVWMDHAHTAFANRCLPMRIAGQSGWFVLNPAPIEVTWNGGKRQRDLTIRQLSDVKNRAALSHFGHGILTWWIPYIFRTPRGYNMHVRGPANWCKDGVCALDAIVETDWAVASFPMSWKMTRPNHPVIFDKDEPFCMISPQRRGEVESFLPEIHNLSEEKELRKAFQAWSASRKSFNASLLDPDPALKWQKHYFLGTHPAGGDIFEEHQVRLSIAPFAELRPPRRPPAPKVHDYMEAGASSAMEEAASAEAHPISCPFARRNQADPASPAAQFPGEPCVVSSFFEQASALTDWVARCFQPAGARLDQRPNAWQVLGWKGQAPFLRALAAELLPSDLLLALEERLSAWAADNLPGHRPAEIYATLAPSKTTISNITSAEADQIRFLLALTPSDVIRRSATILLTSNSTRSKFVKPSFNDLLIFDGKTTAMKMKSGIVFDDLPGFLYLEGSFLSVPVPAPERRFGEKSL